MWSINQQSHTQVRCPNQRATKSDAVCPFRLLLESYRIVVGDPLVIVKNEIIHRTGLVVNRRYCRPLLAVRSFYDVLDFKVAQNATGLRARTFSRGATEWAAGFDTRRIRESERSTVEPESDEHLLRRNIHTPEKLRSQLNLREIGVSLDNASDRIVGVPGSVEIVTHQVDPIDMLH